MEKYYDFGPTFASEKLDENDGIKISKETVRGIGSLDRGNNQKMAYMETKER